MSSTHPSNDDLWIIIIETLEFAQEYFQQWISAGRIDGRRGDEVLASLQAQLEEYRKQAAANVTAPVIEGLLPPHSSESETSRGFRNWTYISHLLRGLRAERKLPLSQFHGLESEANERLLAMRRRLSREAGRTAPQSEFRSAVRNVSRVNVFNETVPEPKETTPRRSLLEIILDPQSIQWLLGLGGALFVAGLVILLWINEFFTPARMAIAMGVGNLTVLVGGLSTIRFTRYQMAGKALALLACLVMPLNLWYYHSHDLITIDGHLWVAALVISALYAASAVVLKDKTFVYVFNLGITLTGLLMIADLPPSPARFWEIAPPATLLVILGLLGIHLERAFPISAGPFSRDQFGLAFFISGHLQLAAGLLLVFTAQLTGEWLYPILFKPIFQAMHLTPSPICGELRWLALVLVLASTYAYVYSDVVVRRHGVYVHFAAFTLLWAEVIGVQMLHLEIGVDAMIAVLAVTSLLVHVAHVMIADRSRYTRSFPVFGLLLGILPVLMGIFVYVRYFGLRALGLQADDPARWSYVGAMVLTAIASRVGAHVYRHTEQLLTRFYFGATGASTMIAAVAGLAALGFDSWQEHAPILMLIPIAYLVAAKLYGDRSPAEPLNWVAHAATIVMLISSMGSAFQGFTGIVERQPLNLALALFFAEAAVFYGLATAFRKQPLFVYLATLMASGSVWQLLTYAGVATETYILVFAFVGLGLLIGYRLSIWEQSVAGWLSEAAFQAANTLLSLSFISSGFLGLSRLALGTLSWHYIGVSVTLLLMSLAAVAFVQHSGWRRWYIVTTVGEGALTLLALHHLIHLSPWQQVELFSVIVGLLLLAVGHLGWYREQERESDLVSMSLVFGALLASIPLAIATWIDRGHDRFSIVNEFGFLFVSVLLLATGIMFQLKATTLIGSAMTMLYFVTLLLFVPWSRLNAIAVVITIGGGTIFSMGLVLAFFRDRLLTLPDRIKNRDGLFRILEWR